MAELKKLLKSEAGKLEKIINSLDLKAQDRIFSKTDVFAKEMEVAKQKIADDYENGLITLEENGEAANKMFCNYVADNTNVLYNELITKNDPLA